MKKIGILTFAVADNYGAVLQAYALKRMLTQLGHAAHIINFYYPKTQRVNKFFYNYHPSFKWLIKRIAFFIFKPFYWYYSLHCFTPFRKKYLTDTPRVYKNDLPSLVSKYDLFIAGSDQVFNPNLTQFEDDFFLAFSKDISKNASYSASFGKSWEEFTPKAKDFIRMHIKHLKYLSVREKAGQEIVHKLAPQQQAYIHIDPTLLLNKSFWGELAVKPNVTQKYAIVYLMRVDKDFLNFAKQIAYDNGWKLIKITSQADLTMGLPRFHTSPTVEEWVGWLLNAQCIFTNSFHGLAFAINFNVPFWTNSIVGKMHASSRISNLLELTGLLNRQYIPNKPITNTPIDWNFVNQQLETEREKSWEYLRKITK